MTKANDKINAIVARLEAFLKNEYGKCSLDNEDYSSGDGTYHIYKLTVPNNNRYIIDNTCLKIARDWFNGCYMAEFECIEGKLDLFFGFATKQKNTIRWRYYSDGEYCQDTLKDWFMSEEMSQTFQCLIRGTGVEEDGHEGHFYHTLHKKPRSLYGMNTDDAVKEIADVYSTSSEIAKASIMKQTMLKGDYDSVRFWSGVSIPEPEEDDDDNKDYDNCDEFTNSLAVEELIEIFDNMDGRFNSWCTPSYAMLKEMIKSEGLK